jgi:hypothetical protein
MVGEAFIKELDLGRVILRLNESEDGSQEKIVAELSMDTRLMME